MNDEFRLDDIFSSQQCVNYLIFDKKSAQYKSLQSGVLFSIEIAEILSDAELCILEGK